MDTNPLNRNKMKTLNEVLLNHVNLESSIPQGEKDWVNSHVSHIFNAMEEYAQQFASQSSDKEEREVKDGFEKWLKDRCAKWWGQASIERKDIYHQLHAEVSQCLSEYRNFSPPKESDGKELSEPTYIKYDGVYGYKLGKYFVFADSEGQLHYEVLTN